VNLLGSELPLLRGAMSRPRNSQAKTSDADDLVTQVVAERGHYPGRCVPSQAYQLTGLLELHLPDLQRLVIANPDWLQE
jgi:hypothetical protein